jgi:dipeptidase
MKRLSVACFVIVLLVMAASSPVDGCTNFLISKGASADGSTMITYAADSHDFFGALSFIPPGVHPEGATRDIFEWDTGKHLGQIREAPVTYSVVGLMNEHQVAIGETTFDGREELKGTGIVDYGSLMFIALQRSTSAREAIKVIGELVAEYGYASTGESFSISDPDEVWILEIIGKGEADPGAVWVARKIPDGFISGHANQARIRTFPLDEPETCLYSQDVISFARDQGYFDGEDASFSFADVYAPLTYGALRFCEARVWCMFNRTAPSQQIPSELVTGADAEERLPLWIRPDHKLSVSDVMGLMRDHFEGTDLDMTQDAGAGPYRLPYRWRPLTWEVEGVEYFNERAVSTQQTGFSFVAQSRSWLPDPIGGVLWFGVDDTYSTVYFPVYCAVHEVPQSFAENNGSLYDFTWDSAFWVFNWVSNFAYLRYSDMIEDIRTVQQELEGRFLSDQPAVEQAAEILFAQSPRLAVDYLTEYSVKAGDELTQRWTKLGEFLLVKYIDGNVKTPTREVTHPGYPERWYRGVVGDAGEKLKMKKVPGEPDASE